jgi:sugar O-acyltransferase (sialic acid O-acetyltransferase NeuD family)
MTEVLGIFGTGGHGRECAWLALDLGWSKEKLRFVVNEEFMQADVVDGIAVMTASSFGHEFAGASVVVAVGDPAKRALIVKGLEAYSHKFPPLISKRAILSPSVDISEGVIVFPGSFVSVNVELGAHSHINANCSISHDCIIGSFSSLSPGVNICGHVSIGAEVFVGANACVINGTPYRKLSICDGASIGAGACVVNDVEAAAQVVGVPARAIGNR